MPQASIWETVTDNSGLLSNQVEVTKKITLKLLTKNLEKTLMFYKVFFDVDPVSSGPDFAHFDLENPPLNILLDTKSQSKTSVGHYGVQVKSSSVVRDMADRLVKSGFKLITEDEADCCYALQSKVWAADPDGHRWEIFVVTEAETDNGCGPDCICHADFDRTVLAS